MSLTYGFSLKEADDSAEFSSALHAVIGDGIAWKGGRLALTVNGFTAALASGYAYAAGRYLENDEPYSMTIGPPGNNDDRTDALAVRVDYTERKAALEVLADVDPASIQASPTTIRDDGQYCIVLYLIRVRRGATSLTPDDVTDLRDNKNLCGRVVPLSDIAGDVLYIYSFLTGGIDAEVDRLIGLSNQVIAKADTAIVELDKQIQQAGGRAEIGELMTSRHPPSEAGWLLCDGGTVPAEYAALNALLGGALPYIPGGRYKTYIFGGMAGGLTQTGAKDPPAVQA